MVDVNKVSRERLFRCQSPMLEKARVVRGEEDFTTWLRVSLQLARYSLIHWLVRKPYHFDGVSEVELWFEADKWDDITVTVIAVTK